MANETATNANKSLGSVSYASLIEGVESALSARNEYAVRNFVVEMASRRGLSHVEMSNRIVRGEYR